MSTTNWARVAASDYAVPEGVSLPKVIDELLEMLGDSDPEIRDTQAYSTLAAWTRAGQFDAELERLASAYAGLLTGRNVLSRSFAGLILGEAVWRDAELVQASPRPAGVQALAFRAWTDWYPHGPDVCSHDAQLGWIHTVAHGADAAGALARHPLTTPDQLRSLLDTLTERLRTLPLHLNQIEDDRLALAMLAALSRSELRVSGFQEWLEQYQTLWTTLEPGVIPPGPVLAVRTLYSLHTLLHLGAVLAGQTLQPAYPAEALAAVQGALRSVYPYYVA